MYTFMKKEENIETGNIFSGTGFNQPNDVQKNQKPSPTMGDEGVKEETVTQNSSEVTNFAHKSRFARKSGLKPIRPGSVSTSLLTAITPARPQTQNFTSSFRDNEPVRALQFDKPYTPKSVTKFLRSESTPELNRFKKSSKQLLMSTDKTSSFLSSERKRNEHSSCYTLSSSASTTTETLPDIFCKPLTQAKQSDSAFNYKWKPCGLDEKMSKWGYGPSVTDGAKAEPSQEAGVEEISPVKVKPEEVKATETNHQSNNFNKWSAATTAREQPFTFSQKTNTSVSTFSRTLEKPSFSLGSSQTNQNTVKENIVPSKPVEQDPSISANTQPTKVPLLELMTTSNTILKPLENKIEKLPETQKESIEPPVVKPQVSPVEQPRQIAVPPAQANLPANRPPTKGKQISVNGKTYTVMKSIGRGGSSVVYQVLNTEMTDMFALKVVRLDSVDEVTAEGYINEVRLLKQLQGLPRVVRLVEYEYDEREEKLLLVMEKGDTDFASVIRSRSSQNSTISPTLIRFYWQEMLEAVGSIHDKNVVHSDLKPANFLLVNGGLKLIDFGIAASIQSDMTSIFKDTQCGTCNYMAPEAIKSHSPAGAAQQEYKINKKTDVWSLGCILYNLIYKNPPFHKIRDTFEKLNAIVDDKYVIDFPPGADPLAVDVLKACLDRNPLHRPTIAQLLSHPYLTYSCPTVHSQPQEKFAYLQTVLAPLIDNGKFHDDVKEWLTKMM